MSIARCDLTKLDAHKNQHSAKSGMVCHICIITACPPQSRQAATLQVLVSLTVLLCRAWCRAWEVTLSLADMSVVFVTYLLLTQCANIVSFPNYYSCKRWLWAFTATVLTCHRSQTRSSTTRNHSATQSYLPLEQHCMTFTGQFGLVPAKTRDHLHTIFNRNISSQIHSYHSLWDMRTTYDDYRIYFHESTSETLMQMQTEYHVSPGITC